MGGQGQARLSVLLSTCAPVCSATPSHGSYTPQPPQPQPSQQLPLTVPATMLPRVTGMRLDTRNCLKVTLAPGWREAGGGGCVGCGAGALGCSDGGTAVPASHVAVEPGSRLGKPSTPGHRAAWLSSGATPQGARPTAAHPQRCPGAQRTGWRCSAPDRKSTRLNSSHNLG